MYPMLFMERFWRGEPKNELFVAMPMPPDGSFESRFTDVIRHAAERVGLEARRSREILGSNAIFTQILSGIANSRMVLCDLSDDPRGPKGYANGNVLHEAGIAMTIHEPHSVVLIREQSPDSLKDFDVRFTRIRSPSDGKITEDWLANILKDALEGINLAETERIRVIADCLDDACFELIVKYGTLPEGKNNFYIPKQSVGELLAARRLIDLGVLRFATAREINPLQYSYRWTSLAKPLIEFLKIHEAEKLKQLSERPFA